MKTVKKNELFFVLFFSSEVRQVIGSMKCLFILIPLSVHLAVWATTVHRKSRNCGILGDLFPCMSASAKTMR